MGAHARKEMVVMMKSKSFKKIVALALAFSVIVSGSFAIPKKVEAKQKVLRYAGTYRLCCDEYGVSRVFTARGLQGSGTCKFSVNKKGIVKLSQTAAQKAKNRVKITALKKGSCTITIKKKGNVVATRSVTVWTNPETWKWEHSADNPLNNGCQHKWKYTVDSGTKTVHHDAVTKKKEVNVYNKEKMYCIAVFDASGNVLESTYESWMSNEVTANYDYDAIRDRLVAEEKVFLSRADSDKFMDKLDIKYADSMYDGCKFVRNYYNPGGLVLAYYYEDVVVQEAYDEEVTTTGDSYYVCTKCGETRR